MHQAIEKIIDRLVGAVKTDKPFYTLKDLASAGYPSFIIERIRLMLNEKLEEDLILPNTAWADLETKFVTKAWQDFKQAVFSNSQIPQKELYEITGSVVDEIVKVYLEPRQHMAEYIYKGKEELSYEELKKRTSRLTIYKHFGRAIPLYMQKRKLNTLEKKRCKLLIHNLDANLMASYSAEEWARVLKLLFRLFDGKIDSKLIQLFFEDKGLYLTANTFNELNEEITHKKFIEIISNPDLLNVELQEEYREKYREKLVKQKNRFDKPDDEIIDDLDEKEQRLLDNFIGKYQEEEEPIADEESLNALYKTDQKDKALYESHESDPKTEEAEKPKGKEKNKEESQRFRQNLTSVLDLAASSYNNLSNEEEEEPEKKIKKAKSAKKEKKKKAQKEDDKKKSSSKRNEPEDAKIISEKVIDEKDDTEEKPMWQQFISLEQMDLVMGNKSSTDKDEDSDEETGIFVDDEELIEEPVVDIVPEEDELTVADLRVHLLGQEVFYIEELFGGSEAAYERVLERIIVNDSWEDATEYLQNNVFSSPDVDMFSDAAIDFTDQLQDFFKEHKN